MLEISVALPSFLYLISGYLSLLFYFCIILMLISDLGDSLLCTQNSSFPSSPCVYFFNCELQFCVFVSFVHFKEIKHIQLKVKFVINFFLRLLTSILQADDVEGKIRQIIPPGFCTNTNDFLSLLEKEVDFKPFGTLLHTYSVLSPTGGENFTFQIYKVKRNLNISWVKVLQLPETCMLLCCVIFSDSFLASGNKFLSALKTKIYFVCVSVYTS